MRTWSTSPSPASAIPTSPSKSPDWAAGRPKPTPPACPRPFASGSASPASRRHRRELSRPCPVQPDEGSRIDRPEDDHEAQAHRAADARRAGAAHRSAGHATRHHAGDAERCHGYHLQRQSRAREGRARDPLAGWYDRRAVPGRADYVLVLNPADTRGDLTGWVTIDNKSGAIYRNALLKLVAGDVNRAVDRFRDVKALEMAARAPATAEARRDFQSEGFFEYHLYTLDGRTTIKDNQTKQLSLLAATDIGIDKQLIYYGAQDYYRTSYGTPISNQKVGVYLEIKNSQANRLGVPLPKARVRAYTADTGGSQQFVGEDWIDHTPKDERVKIKMGEAFDVVGERTQRNFQKIGPRTWEVEWEISLRNHKKDAQTVTGIEPVPGDWQVLQSSHAPEKIEAHTLRFRVDVPKEDTVKLVYRVRVRY